MNKIKSCFFCIFVTFSVFANEKEECYITHVIHSIENADRGESNLSPAVLAIPGMTSIKIRALLNNLCSFPNTSYLEIGVLRGATLISALYGNQSTVIKAIGIDNWSEFGCAADEVAETIQKLIPNIPLKFYEVDCFSMEKNRAFSTPVNVYFYDGNHSQLSQELAFTYFNDIFDDVFIAVIDDWNWDWVRAGTFAAFKKLGYQILFEKSFFTPPKSNDSTTWWNGLYIAVLKK